MKRGKLLIAITLALIMLVPMSTMASASGLTETYTIKADTVTYTDEKCADGFGWRYGEYYEIGNDVSNRMYVNFPIDGLLAYKIAGAVSYTIDIDFTWATGSGVYSGTYPGTALCDSYDWQTWLVMWSNNGEVAGQRAAEMGSVSTRYYTFPDVSISSTEVFENDMKKCNYIQYEMYMKAYNIKERACMRTSITNAVMTITLHYDNEQSAQLVVDNYNANIATKVEQNQQTIINQGNTIITPDAGDKVVMDNMQSEVENKGNQSDQLLVDSKVEKPIVTDDVLNPMNKVDDGALDNMGGMIGAVFVSPTLGSIAILTLTFALLGYILYGKR